MSDWQSMIEQQEKDAPEPIHNLEMRVAERLLSQAIDACNELAKLLGTMVIAKQEAERARKQAEEHCAADHEECRRLAAARDEALALLAYGLQLRQHGEQAPGGRETWAEFDRKTEALLRSQMWP